MMVSDLKRRFVLVLEDVRETATLIRSLLTSSGFRVALAADEEDAITRARAEPPDLVVISLGLETAQLIAVADRIRENAGMAEPLPIVIFCVPTIPEGSEIEVGAKTYLVRLDNFNQLRTMLGRLLATGSGV
jgi:CheY-like chemotaxis protein